MTQETPTFDPAAWQNDLDGLLDQLPHAGLKSRLKAQFKLQLTAELGRQEGWKWRSYANACEPKPPRQYAVAGLLPIPSTSTVYGAPGGLKTMSIQDLALCVASGRPWLDALPGETGITPFQVLQAPVLWVDVDNGLDRTERRFAAIGQAHAVPEDAPLAYLSFPTPPFVASDIEAAQMMIDAVQQMQAKLVVFDNLGTISGGADENSSQMVAVMSGLRQIAELGDCAVIVIHHKSKGNRDRVGDSLRGHSSIEGALDLALLVEREGDDDTITLRSTKTRDIPVRAFSALWTYKQDPSGELVKGRFFGLGKPEAAALSKQEQAELCIRKDIAGRMNQSQLVALVKQGAGIGRNTAIAAIRRLVDSGELRELPKQAKGAIFYEKAQAV